MEPRSIRFSFVVGSPFVTGLIDKFVSGSFIGVAFEVCWDGCGGWLEVALMSVLFSDWCACAMPDELDVVTTVFTSNELNRLYFDEKMHVSDQVITA